MDGLADSELYIKILVRNICFMKEKSKSLHVEIYKIKEKINFM